MIIAIDFDNTIAEVTVENGIVTKINEPLPGAIETIEALYKAGHELIVWTCRDDIPSAFLYFIEEMNAWLYEHKVNHCFSGINEQSEGWNKHAIWSQASSRKIYADMYIDDKNFGGFPGWNVIAQELLSNT